MSSPLEFLKDLLSNQTDIFQTNDTQKIQNAMAILISHIIMADGKITQEENKKVLSFFQNEFNLEESETQKLFNAILDNLHEFQEHLDVLTQTIKSDSHAKHEILRHINNIIICDGCIDREYEVFEAIKASLM